MAKNKNKASNSQANTQEKMCNSAESMDFEAQNTNHNSKKQSQGPNTKR